MKMVKFEANNHEIEIVCTSRNTRHGFAHDANLFVDGIPWYGTAHCYYLNRTWECWTYQSVCLEVVRSANDSRRAWLKENYKYENNVARITKKHSAALEEIYNADEDVKTMRAAFEVLRDRSF